MRTTRNLLINQWILWINNPPAVTSTSIQLSLQMTSMPCSTLNTSERFNKKQESKADRTISSCIKFKWQIWTMGCKISNFPHLVFAKKMQLEVDLSRQIKQPYFKTDSSTIQKESGAREVAWQTLPWIDHSSTNPKNRSQLPSKWRPTCYWWLKWTSPASKKGSLEVTLRLPETKLKWTSTEDQSARRSKGRRRSLGNSSSISWGVKSKTSNTRLMEVKVSTYQTWLLIVERSSRINQERKTRRATCPIWSKITTKM